MMVMLEAMSTTVRFLQKFLGIQILGNQNTCEVDGGDAVSEVSAEELVESFFADDLPDEWQSLEAEALVRGSSVEGYMAAQAVRDSLAEDIEDLDDELLDAELDSPSLVSNVEPMTPPAFQTTVFQSSYLQAFKAAVDSNDTLTEFSADLCKMRLALAEASGGRGIKRNLSAAQQDACRAGRRKMMLKSITGLCCLCNACKLPACCL